ncbi:MAG: hypothetical protein IK095_02365 [Oscillospiraceae bacterium]|nr:hypothetical protein [Oscillospiraceae bacterium]
MKNNRTVEKSLYLILAPQAYPNLWNVAAEESEKRNPTQIASTQGTYRKIYTILKNQGFTGTILDASSGLGLGTKVGREEFGFDVEDIEPYPGDGYKPMYTDYSKLHKQYDAIISSAVLNVLPQDQRDALVVKMGELLRPGGKMYITTRGSDVESLAKTGKNIHLGEMEWIETVKGSYQKSFTQSELKAYLEDALGPGFTVELSSAKNGGKFNNNTSIVVTKKAAPAGGVVQFSVRETTDGRKVAVVDDDILAGIDTSAWDKNKKEIAKKAAANAMKAFISGVTKNGVTRKVNKTSRDYYTRGNNTEKYYNRNKDVFADKLRAASVIGDIITVADTWVLDGGLWHQRSDSFVDFEKAAVLFQAGENQYEGTAVCGVTAQGERVFYDVDDIVPTTFTIKNVGSPTNVTTQEAPDAIHGNPTGPNISDEPGKSNTPAQLSMRDSAARDVDLLKRAYIKMLRDKQWVIDQYGKQAEADLGTYQRQAEDYRAKEKEVYDGLQELDRLVREGGDPEAVKAQREKVTAAEGRMTTALKRLSKLEERLALQGRPSRSSQTVILDVLVDHEREKAENATQKTEYEKWSRGDGRFRPSFCCPNIPEAVKRIEKGSRGRLKGSTSAHRKL